MSKERIAMFEIKLFDLNGNEIKIFKGESDGFSISCLGNRLMLNIENDIGQAYDDNIWGAVEISRILAI